jgi:dipeptidyl aminopeptidase/acylaminoacyl peptidase
VATGWKRADRLPSRDGDRAGPRQLYFLDPGTGATTPLVEDADYDHASFTWDPTGQELLLQRSQVWAGGATAESDKRSQIWIYDTAKHSMVQVATNAFNPRWVP